MSFNELSKQAEFGQDDVIKLASDLIEKDQESDELYDENYQYEENKNEVDGDIETDIFEGFNGSGRTVTLQMLLAANFLQPGRASMTIEYLGQKFVGDLLPDGKIKSHETETVFLSPSAWAMHCKRIINPEKKSGCGWASVKYKGRKLDAFKATWMRKCAQQNIATITEGDEIEMKNGKTSVALPLIQRNVMPHNTIIMRNVMHDVNTLIETAPFDSVNKLQPFLLCFSSSALLLADFHSHLTLHEVCGYFGGTWDVNSHTLTVTKTYPCRNCRYDREKAADVEKEVQKHLLKDQLMLVGWYHSHVKFQSQPTCRDIDAQLDYQMKMRGPSDMTYTPCIGVIISTYHEKNQSYESSVTPFWVIPPPENRQIQEYGRPLFMEYSFKLDKNINPDIRQEMEACVNYYAQFSNELINFKDTYKDVNFIGKLKMSLYSKFPSKENGKQFWNFICKLLNCIEEEHFLEPTITSFSGQEEIQIDFKEDELTPAADIKVMSLQEQLALPSGLNMNPTRLTSPLAAPNIAAITNAMSTSITSTSSPRDSPITIPSNSASPAKFELPVRASPSPAKSDTSSSRTRLSPIPSPGKFSVSDIPRNSPSITPNIFDCIPTSRTSDLMTASTASLTDQISPNLSTGDLSLLLQHQKDYGNISLNQLAVAASKAGSKESTGSVIQNSYDSKMEGAYSGNYNALGKSKTGAAHQLSRYSKQESKSHKQSPGTSYKTKLMKELEDLKNDPIKISELMRSPEYAALLLQQAEALGATTLGTLGLGADFSFLGGIKQQTQQPLQSVDYTNLLQASKLLGYDSYMQQTRSTADLTTFLQQQLAQSMKKQQSQQSVDYSSLMQTYSKIFDATNIYATSSPNIKNSTPSELTAILHGHTIASNCSGVSRKQKESRDLLHQTLQSDRSTDISAFLYHQSKATVDLNELFVTPTVSMNSASKHVADSSPYYSQLAQEKLQEYATFFKTHTGKYNIPDPLSKSTLATNNMFMTPSALLKLQHESLNAMMMKPPKSNSSSTRHRDCSSSPAHERLTSSKNGRGENSASSVGVKYNFNAVDLAISSVAPTNPSSSPEILRRPAATPPIDLTRMYTDTTSTKKRMEFSSIADLVASPPTKQPKSNDLEDRILNLSSN